MCPLSHTKRVTPTTRNFGPCPAFLQLTSQKLSTLSHLGGVGGEETIRKNSRKIKSLCFLSLLKCQFPNNSARSGWEEGRMDGEVVTGSGEHVCFFFTGVGRLTPKAFEFPICESLDITSKFRCPAGGGGCGWGKDWTPSSQ